MHGQKAMAPSRRNGTSPYDGPGFGKILADHQQSMAGGEGSGRATPGPGQFRQFMKGWGERMAEQGPQGTPDIQFDPVPQMATPMQPIQTGGYQPQQYKMFRQANRYPNPNEYPFGGAFERGGRFGARKRIIVGENGPEEIVLDKPGTVIANQQLEPNVRDAIYSPISGLPAPADPVAAAPFANPGMPTHDDERQLPAGAGMFRGAVGPFVSAPAEDEPAIVPTRTASPLDQTRQKIADLDSGKVPESYKREGNPLKRLAQGMFRGWKNWDGQGGLIAGAVTALAGGIGEASSHGFARGQAIKGEKNKMFRQLQYQMANEEFDNKQETQEAQTANIINQAQNRSAQTIIEAGKARDTAINQRSQRALEKYKAMSRYKKGDNPALDVELAAAGTFPDKEPDDQLSMQIAPDGRPIIFNKKTGKVEVGEGNFGKPPQFDDKDLPDDLVGLMTDKELSDRAQAQVGKLPDGRVLNEAVSNRLASVADSSGERKYLKPDGTFNEERYWNDYSKGLTEIKPSELYANLPDNYEQKLAASRTKLRDSQKHLREQWTDLKTVLKTRSNPSNPEFTTSVPDVVAMFREAMKQKDPQKALAALKDRLARSRIN